MKFTLALGIGMLLFVLPLAAQEKPGPTASATIVVVATGVGVDADKSLRNAFRNAVEQAVGLVLDGETVVKNEEVIKDLILTYSDGFVEKFDRVKEGKRDDGLYEVRIKAVVKRRQLIEKLKEAKVSVTKVEGESLFAEIVTKLDAEKSAAKLLEKALEGLPATLLTATIADPKPQIIEKGELTIKAAWNIEVAFDYEQYRKSVFPKLAQILGDTALRKGSQEILDRADRADTHDLPMATLSKNHSFWPDRLWRDRMPAEANIPSERGELGILLNSAKNETGDFRRWSWFVMDKATISPVLNSLMKRAPVLSIVFVGGEEQIIREERISFDKAFQETPFLWENRRGKGFQQSQKRAAGQFPWFCYTIGRGSAGDRSDTAVLGPYIRVSGPGILGQRYGEAVDYSYQAQFSLDEIKNIRKIRCSISNEQK